MLSRRPHLGHLALIAALAFVAADAVGRARHLCALRSLGDIHVASPALTSNSETGYAGGERELILPDTTIDSYHEIMQAQTMLAGGGWRIREVFYDHPPRGRQVHWSFPPRAWLASVAWLCHVATGRPLGASVEDAALVANPLLFAIFLVVAIPWLGRKFGSVAAALAACATVASYPFSIHLVSGDAEHQGIAEILALLGVALLLDGRSPSSSEDAARRRRFIAAGVAAGVGLWISAASEAPVILGTGLGAMLSLWLSRPSHRPPPELWRLWGLCGAGVSLAAYVLEYFPSHLGWRFEVNHPVYALAWGAGGEAICRFGRCLNPPRGEIRRRELEWGIGAAAAVAGLAAAIALTRRTTFWIADPFLWRLHHETIGEFQSLPSYLIRRGFSPDAMAWVLPLFLVLVALVFSVRIAAGDTGPEAGRRQALRAQLILAATPALLEGFLAASQIRWWGIASGLSLVSVLPLLAAVETPDFRGFSLWRWRAACVLLILPGAVVAGRMLKFSPVYTQQEVESLAERDLAHWLRAQSPGHRPVILSTPTLTTELIYHGGLSGVGTLYWENRDGLRAAAAIFDAPSLSAAHALLDAAGVTHLVLASWDPFWSAYIRLNRGLPSTAPISLNPFAAVLFGQAPPPPWLHLTPYSLPPLPALSGQSAWVIHVDR